MTIATWPATLPQYILVDGYDEGLPNLRIESETDSGQTKSRQRFTRNWRPLSGAIACTLAQASIFDAFYINTLAGGTAEFWWRNPVSQSLALMCFRGPPPRRSVFNGLNVRLSFGLWQKRMPPEFRFDRDDITFDSTLFTFDADDTF